MDLLRSLWFFTAYFDISIKATHLPGVLGMSGDMLWRNQLHSFFQLNPDTSRIPTLLPCNLSPTVNWIGLLQRPLYFSNKPLICYALVRLSYVYVTIWLCIRFKYICVCACVLRVILMACTVSCYQSLLENKSLQCMCTEGCYLGMWSIEWCDQLLRKSGKLMWLHPDVLLVGITLPTAQHLYTSVKGACFSWCCRCTNVEAVCVIV